MTDQPLPAPTPPPDTNEFRRGWPVVVAAALGVGVGLTGLPFYSFGVFVQPLEVSQGWSRAEVTTAMLFLSLGSILTGPLLGSLIDRRGVRIVALPSLVGLALGFVLLSRADGSIVTFYACWFALALLGCGTTPLTWSRAITSRFDRQRGLALGLALLGTGLASMLGPPLLQRLIATHGWSAGYLGIAAFIVAVVLPAAWAGLPHGGGSRSRAEAPPPEGLGWREAVKSTVFAKIALSIFLMIVAQSSATVHLVPLLQDRGIAPADAAATASLLGLSIIVGRVLVGWLVDRLHAPYVAATFFALPAVALLLLLSGQGIGIARASAVLLGLAAGAEVDLLAFLIGRYFGLARYGTIYGIALSVFGAGAAFGAPLTSLLVARLGSYDAALIGGVVAFLLGAGLIGSLGPYRYRGG